ncbi:OmpH family outer membrane protein [Halanaerobium hydrogeniformans]|uniref:Outer membrane chaperone Skp (OmpH) n=1 Tax=Halanaerobium hydrogeniformans TaxID=656519 RepID=E4RP65_HALHG|nr:OmpH family outer membrane protein [Halanaerobium hydrogeniformans]ADQ13890.1 outer membrane chaperone Skp (OmpH) [Halanaerobium hydrogeniformans]
MMNWKNSKFQIAVLLLLLAILAALLALGIFSDDQSVDSVAYVNLERIFEKHPARLAAENTLNQKAAEYQQEIETQYADAGGSEQKEIIRKHQAQLQELEAELLDGVIAELLTVIEETAAEKNVKFVLEEEYILYGGYNLTESVLEKIEAKW